MIQKATSEDLICGFSLCRLSPKITPLFFEDDSLLFCWASMNAKQTIQSILILYEQVSGLKINKGKTAIFISKFVMKDLKSSILNFLGVLDVKE